MVEIDYPNWINRLYLPGKLDFYFPSGESEIELNEEADERYHQLINWSMMQSYWYYVIDSPKIVDEGFDRIKKEISDMESEYEGILSVGYTAPHIPLGCSPTITWWNWCWSRYPPYIISMFEGMPIKMKFEYEFENRIQGSRKKETLEKLGKNCKKPKMKYAKRSS